ncbi:MAG: thioredoxin TrxC [Rhodospirillales bacterium]|nr:thioredoxin TrxC [Rhodospirillales bacterium]
MSEAFLHVLCPHCGSINRLPAGKPAEAARCGNCHRALFQGHPVAVDQAGFERHLGADDIPILVDVWAPWCGPCRMMAPTFERAAKSLEPRFRLLKLNADEAPEILSRYGISGIPTLLLFNHGRLAGRQAGAMDEAGIVRWAQSRPSPAHHAP